MVKKSLLTLLFIAIFYFCLEVVLSMAGASGIVLQVVSIIYMWLPGIVAIVFAKKEGTSLSVFKRLNKTFWSIPLVAFVICLLAFLISIPFGMGIDLNPALAELSLAKQIGGVIGLFFTNFLLISILFSFVFLGGELFWRGYLWDRWKDRGVLKTIWMTALIWSLWQIPVTVLTSQTNLFLNIFLIFVLNFVISPVLTYYRVRGGSVYSASLFFSCIMSGFIYFMILFPTTDWMILSIFGGGILLLLLAFSLWKRLFSEENWKKIV